MKLVVTAGPTREYLDTVRFLSNASTGRMGYAIAEAGARRGHHVTLVSGPVASTAPDHVRVVNVTSAAEMLAAARLAFADADAAVMAAAVCDYRPVDMRDRKLPKQTTPFSLMLEPTPDICAELGREKATRVVIGFALEDHDHESHAEEKLRRKCCDAIVLNDVRNVGSDEAEIRILRADIGWQPSVRGTKAAVASEVISLVEAILARHNHETANDA
jgi:phosphopantothenoylcysteine decarboxylase/phosphopantothenate--cysteine ligase